MTPRIYESPRLADGYAYARPAVHPHIVSVVAERLRATGFLGTPDSRARRALDIGCGAGLSTDALEPIAGHRVGLEPVRTMLRHCGEVAPGSRFVVGRAEHLPFSDGAFDLLTAAGSLNYANLDLLLPEAARVLDAPGRLVVYDFSSGRRLPGERRLEDWLASFEERYPFPSGYAMDVRTLDYSDAGLRLESYTTLEVAVPMTPSSYLSYVLSETNVELAVSTGTPERQVEEWCRATLEPIFPAPSGTLLFDAYVAVICRSSPALGAPAS